MFCADDGSNRVGYFGRFLVLCVAALGIILSMTSATGCSFLQFKNNVRAPYSGLGEPFEGATEAYVGIFNYEVVAVDYDSVPEKCEGYPAGASFEVLIAARIVAVAAPIFAAIGVLITIVDTCFGHNISCFIASAFMYLIACGLQACTFVVYAEPTFCFEAPHNCSVGSAGVQSAFACIFYWICCTMTCCFPRPDPYREYRKNPEELRESRVKKIERTVTVEPDVQGGFTPEKLEEEKKKGGRKSRRKGKGSNGVSSELGTNQDNVDRVELNEKKFPDGSRQVDEVTFYKDGTRSVNTTRYGPGE
ncbi:unnamed protein product [Cylindrotheca closterium]|uniref:Uncharacterized protein n=1 Tax=Cylindrotheca closterium TaxID=2856 RepID=A0AAD2CUL3_9STRA|nr:unnamed protein product [Cylindrotheca closterium]